MNISRICPECEQTTDPPLTDKAETLEFICPHCDHHFQKVYDLPDSVRLTYKANTLLSCPNCQGLVRGFVWYHAGRLHAHSGDVFY